MNVVAVYPGMFDPITNGHVDLVGRASRLFDTVIVAVSEHSPKTVAFNLQQRMEMARTVLSHFDNVDVQAFSGLLVDFARSVEAQVLVRGLRAVSDFEYEFQMASMNRRLSPLLESVFLTPTENFAFISSSLVRQVAGLGGDVSSLVHPEVALALENLRQDA